MNYQLHLGDLRTANGNDEVARTNRMKMEQTCDLRTKGCDDETTKLVARILAESKAVRPPLRSDNDNRASEKYKKNVELIVSKLR